MSSKADLVIWALTGERVGLRPGSVLERLSAAGWDIAGVREFREARFAAGEVWPTSPDSAEIDSYAALTAAVTDARHELGLDEALSVAIARRPLNADERRLVADRPPHW